MATQEIYEPIDAFGLRSVEVGDKELTLSFQRGDRSAYDSIYARYSTRVEMVCRRMLSDPQDAQDAAQETFLRVYQALPRFNGRYQLAAWINRIATNVCLDVLRSRSRTPAESAPNEVLEDVVKIESDEDPQEVMLRSAEGDRVQETLASLSPLHRTAILMRDFEGRDYSYIANVLGVTECRARVLLHRARKGFRKSWSSALGILGFPARFLGRFKKVKAPVDQVAQAASSAAHAAPSASMSAPMMSCGQILQQCGDMVTERVAAVATAALVGVTAAGAVPAAPAPAPVRSAPTSIAVAETSSGEVLVSAGEVARGLVRLASSASADASRAHEGTIAVTASPQVVEAVPVEATASTSTEPATTTPLDESPAPADESVPTSIDVPTSVLANEIATLPDETTVPLDQPSTPQTEEPSDAPAAEVPTGYAPEDGGAVSGDEQSESGVVQEPQPGDTGAALADPAAASDEGVTEASVTVAAPDAAAGA
ncbi:MAG: sigma-70 family RNA polymerase sigma factor [Actinomycetota bacterium]